MQVLDIAFDFDVAYTAENPFAAIADSTNAATTAEANVDDYISACKCDSDVGFTCNTNPLAPDDILQVCVKSSSSAVQIAQVTSLVLDNGAQEMSVVGGVGGACGACGAVFAVCLRCGCVCVCGAELLQHLEP